MEEKEDGAGTRSRGFCFPMVQKKEKTKPDRQEDAQGAVLVGDDSQEGHESHFKTQ